MIEEYNDEGDKVRRLYNELITSKMGFIPRGDQDVKLVYKLIRNKYPELCNDRYLCSKHHPPGMDKPEWKHVVQAALQVMKIESIDHGVRRFL